MPYFDHNATSPLLPVAREAWLQANDEAWANPSSPYRISARAHRLLEAARERVGALFHVPAAEIVFTSGATESNNAVIARAARSIPAAAPVLVSPTEHPSVLAPVRAWFGQRVQWLGISPHGEVDVEKLAHQLDGSRGGLVVMMAANNETGLLQTATKTVDELCRERGAWYLCDATQWLGRRPLAGLAPNAFISGSGHKVGGPKGVGVLRVPAAAAANFHGQQGGEQEHGRRAGTENFPAIAAFVAALEFAIAAQTSGDHVEFGRKFAELVLELIPGTIINGGTAPRLWNTVSLRLPRHDNTRWVTRLDKLGFEVSTGSACASGSTAPSHVLAAMGLTADEARRTIRISAGWETPWSDWRLLAAAIENVWQQLEAEGGTGLNP